jgi:hypothetical protein
MKRWWRIAAAVAVAWAQSAAGAEARVAESTAAAPAVPAPAAQPEDAGRREPERPLRDPFAMRGEADGDGFVSAGVAAIPSGIRVVAILSVEGRSSVGALSIPGSKGLHFVQEGEVIQLDSTATSTETPTAAQLYLLVKSITDNEIEIAPRARPQDVRVYR